MEVMDTPHALSLEGDYIPRLQMAAALPCRKQYGPGPVFLQSVRELSVPSQSMFTKDMGPL